MEEGTNMNKCIFHGDYEGENCIQCMVNRLDNKIKKNSSFPIFILKNSILMILGIAIGWVLFSL